MRRRASGLRRTVSSAARFSTMRSTGQSRRAAYRVSKANNVLQQFAWSPCFTELASAATAARQVECVHSGSRKLAQAMAQFKLHGRFHQHPGACSGRSADARSNCSICRFTPQSRKISFPRCYLHRLHFCRDSHGSAMHDIVRERVITRRRNGRRHYRALRRPLSMRCALPAQVTPSRIPPSPCASSFRFRPVGPTISLLASSSPSCPS